MNLLSITIRVLSNIFMYIQKEIEIWRNENTWIWYESNLNLIMIKTELARRETNETNPTKQISKNKHKDKNNRPRMRMRNK